MGRGDDFFKVGQNVARCVAIIGTPRFTGRTGIGIGFAKVNLDTVI